VPDWAAVDEDGPARLQWRPLLYREVRLERVGDRFEMVPRQPGWSVNPQLPRLIERLEVCPDGDLEGLAEALTRIATSQQHPPVPPLDQRILEALSGLVPGIAGELAAQGPPDGAGHRPGPWILFAPDAADSGRTSPLVGEYLQLEACCGRIPRIRVDCACSSTAWRDGVCRRRPCLPLVPLSDAQGQAVERVLRGERLTVIDGPPGTGKTEVIVSLLLNAWVRGRSALVVSAGDRAVDVIRERVGRLETGFPIVVRAGSGPRQEVSEVLRRILASAHPAASESAADAASLLHQRDALREERTRLLSALESDLPERIAASEAVVLAAYTESRVTGDELAQQEAALIDEQAELGLASFAPDTVDDALAATRGWLERMAHYRDLVRQDDQRRERSRTGDPSMPAQAGSGGCRGRSVGDEWRRLGLAPG
jgi:hypothetical protein